ncbi:lymphocyte-specific helicase-like [Lineus longissimus]|uniref:lymphocyte-specific helicase-like n=1 Tax=Lineus longissimus TaxID=88925 RepID=UPI002B4F331C
MATVLEERIESPFQPVLDEAKMPSEEALTEPNKWVATSTGDGAQTIKDGTPNKEGEGSGTEDRISSIGEEDGTSGENIVLTDAMLVEEKKMNEISSQEEQELQKKRDEALMNLNDEISQQRYRRLEFLLNKSTMYTQFLLTRMERQKEEETRKAERLKKRLAKVAERKEKEFEEKRKECLAGIKVQKDSTSDHTKKDECSALKPEPVAADPKPVVASLEPEPKTQPKEKLAPRRSGRKSLARTDATVPDAKPETEKEVKLAPIFSPRRKTRNSLANGAKDLCVPGSQSSDSGNKKQRGKKRKVETLVDFLDEEELRKRAKLQMEAEESQPDRTSEKSDDILVSQEDTDKDPAKSDSVESNLEDNKLDSIDKPDDKLGVDEVDGGKIPMSTDADDVEFDKTAIYSEAVKKTVRIINGEVAPEEQPDLFVGGVLRRYQVDGYMWLRCLYENGINGILADEMGLGKTIQCIAAVAHLVNMGVLGPYLVVAPLSTIPNWVSEFQRFAPKVPVILYHGTADQREILREKIVKAVKIRGDIVSYPVVVTSYEVTMNDRKHMGNFPWKYLIIDEGHRIKNFQCKLIKELKMYKTTHRLLLTGTPLQNNLAELWSLLNFLLPEIFDDLGSFEAWFDIDAIASEGANEKIVAEERQKNILSMLHQILTPFMLRRLKCDVDLVIPPKREILVYAPLAKEQARYYGMAVDKSIRYLVEEKEEEATNIEYDDKGRPKRASRKEIDYNMMIENSQEAKAREGRAKFDPKGDDDDDDEFESWVNKVAEFSNNSSSKRSAPEFKKSVVHLQMRNMMMLLRRICNHPYLVEYPLNDAGQFKVDEALVASCGKMMLLDKMLAQLKKGGHKVLIFSQMTSMLDVLEDFCYLRKYKFSRLDGSMNVMDRKEQMEMFNEDKDVFIFLLSTRAGGLGINLTAADTCIIYDSDWNPQADLQAQDRCHRIGQTVPVLVFRFVTAKTIDQKIVERAATKRKLEKMVIHKGRFKKGMKDYSEKLSALDPKELLELLKSSDYQSVVDGQSKSGHDVISNRILNKLLDRQELYDIWLDNMDDKKEADKIRGRRGRSVADVAADEGLEGVYKVIDSELGRSAFDEEAKKQETLTESK